MLPSQDRKLMPQQHEFDVFSELGPSTPNEQAQNSREGKISEGKGIDRSSQAQRTPSQLTALAPFSGFRYSRAHVNYEM